MRAAGQGLAYNVGRGLAALGPGFIGITADAIGLGESIMIVGFVACALAITCVGCCRDARQGDRRGGTRTRSRLRVAQSTPAS